MKKLFNVILITPVIIYSVFLIALPLIYILILSFLKNDFYGGIINEFTLNNYISLLDAVYIKVFLKSFLIALITTAICILISYPFCIFVSKKNSYLKKIFMTLVIIPFLTNSLIRTYGIIILLRKEGIANAILQGLNITNGPIDLMYNDFGIIFGMVYTLLPFMVLPLFSSVDKINPSIIEAAGDLGANKKSIFKEIILPQTIPGLFNGSLMVFIPTIGFFFISDLLGGGKLMLLGNLIKNQFLTARNWPFGAAISIVLILITFLLVNIYKKLGGDMDELGGF
jgi:spermidine/putrescine transport system permease protein